MRAEQHDGSKCTDAGNDVRPALTNDRKASMSFSITIFEKDVESTFTTAINDKVAAMEVGDGKDEAELLTPTIAKAVADLSRGEVEFSSAFITGDITNERAQLNVNVSFKRNVPTDPGSPPQEERPVANPAEGS